MASSEHIRHRKLARVLTNAILVVPAAAVARVILTSIKRWLSVVSWPARPIFTFSRKILACAL